MFDSFSYLGKTQDKGENQVRGFWSKIDGYESNHRRSYFFATQYSNTVLIQAKNAENKDILDISNMPCQDLQAEAKKNKISKWQISWSKTVENKLR